MEQVKAHAKAVLGKVENYIRTSDDPVAKGIRQVETRLGVDALHLILGEEGECARERERENRQLWGDQGKGRKRCKVQGCGMGKVSSDFW